LYFCAFLSHILVKKKNTMLFNFRSIFTYRIIILGKKVLVNYLKFCTYVTRLDLLQMEH
jgi:hypothetical protein